MGFGRWNREKINKKWIELSSRLHQSDQSALFSFDGSITEDLVPGSEMEKKLKKNLTNHAF